MIIMLDETTKETALVALSPYVYIVILLSPSGKDILGITKENPRQGIFFCNNLTDVRLLHHFHVDVYSRWE